MVVTPAAEVHPSQKIGCCNCGHTHLVPTYCGNRFCSICGRKRLLRIRNQMRVIVHAAKFKPGYHWRHWIFTVPNSDNPGEAAVALLKSFRRLRQRVFWKNHTTGGFFAVEFTVSGTSWHVHLHVAVHATFMPVAEIRKQWGEVSAGRYVRLGDCPSGKISGYLTKYLTSSKLDPSDQVLASRSFRNRRLYGVFGFAHALHLRFPKSLFPCPKCGLTDGWFSFMDPFILSSGRLPWGYRRPAPSL